MKRLISTLLVSVICSGIMAQQKSMSDSIYTISGVEVMAKKKKKIELLNMDIPLDYIPITLTKLDEVTLERKNIVNLEDAVRFLPGVTVKDQLGAFQRYSVRGTSDAVVAINGVRDERSLINNVPFGDLSSVESIEVIKGPASVLSGHSVMGGVINIIQKKTTEDFTANAKITYGSWNIKQSTIGFGGKLYGPVNYRANLHYSTGDGYRNVGADRFSGLYAIGSEIGKTGYLDASISFNDDRYRTEIGSAPLMPGDIFLTATDQLYATSNSLNPMADYHTTYNDLANNKMRRRNIDLSVQYTQQLTKWMNLRERFTYGHSNLDYSAVEKMSYRTSTKPVYDWYYVNSKGVKTYVELDSLKSGSPLCFNPDTRGWTNTFDLTGKFATGGFEHSYTLGWNYSFFDYTQYNGYASDDVWGPGVNQMLPLNNPHTVRNWWDSKVSAVNIRQYLTNGIYLHDVIAINEQWKGMLSGRLDLYDYKRATATTNDGRQHYNDENRTDWNSVKTSAFTYRAGVVYLPRPSVSLYLSASSYFKPLVTFFNAETIYLDRDGNRFDPDAEGGQVYRPEEGNQAELGVRYNLRKVLEINASVFYINKYNVVKSLGTMDEEVDGAVVTKTVQGQVGRAMSKGFDMDITYRPLPTLQFAAGWGWSDYRLRKANVNLEDWPDFSETTNIRATGIPRTTLYLYGDYTVPRGILENLSFHLSGTYTDRIYRSIADNTYYPSLFLFDMGAYYTIKKQIRLSFLLNNVFDKEYFVKTTTLGKPRNFKASIAYTFR